MTGGYTHHDGVDACYILTAVYGSYDCPSVWTLCRFRDRSLKATPLGPAVYLRVSRSNMSCLTILYTFMH